MGTTTTKRERMMRHRRHSIFVVLSSTQFFPYPMPLVYPLYDESMMDEILPKPCSIKHIIRMLILVVVVLLIQQLVTTRRATVRVQIIVIVVLVTILLLIQDYL